MNVLREESLELSKFLTNIIPDFIQQTTSLEPFYRSFLNSYKRHDSRIHLHIAFDDAVGANLCICLEYRRRVDPSDLPPKNSTRENWSSLVIDPPRKTEPQEVGSFGLRGSVGAGITGIFQANVTQVTVSSNRSE